MFSLNGFVVEKLTVEPAIVSCDDNELNDSTNVPVDVKSSMTPELETCTFSLKEILQFPVVVTFVAPSTGENGPTAKGAIRSFVLKFQVVLFVNPA